MSKSLLEFEGPIDKRSKHRGWAPGEYYNKCMSCGNTFIGDKRAISCAPCAYFD